MPKQDINGVLLLDKALGISSNRALQQIKYLYQAQKAGHTGTLDPLATGLLPICFGEATKFSQHILEADKTYRTNLKFGSATTTGDIEGEIILESSHCFANADLEAILSQFQGQIHQVPPMFSALKHEGVPLYQYARKGIDIERKSREVIIHSIKILNFDFPNASLEVYCSKGTYIRTLAEDIAKALGTVAHLTALVRTSIGPFQLENACTFESLKDLTGTKLNAQLLSLESLVQKFDKFVLNQNQESAIKNGKLVQINSFYEIITTLSLFTQDNQFIGLAEYLPEIKSIKVIRLVKT